MDGETFCQFRSVSLVVVAVVVVVVLSLRDENVVSRMYIVFRIPDFIVVTADGVAIFAVYVFIIFNIFLNVAVASFVGVGVMFVYRLHRLIH